MNEFRWVRRCKATCSSFSSDSKLLNCPRFLYYFESLKATGHSVTHRAYNNWKAKACIGRLSNPGRQRGRWQTSILPLNHRCLLFNTNVYVFIVSFISYISFIFFLKKLHIYMWFTTLKRNNVIKLVSSSLFEILKKLF